MVSLKGDRSSGCSAARNLKRIYLIGQSVVYRYKMHRNLQMLVLNVSENMFRNCLRHKQYFEDDLAPLKLQYTVLEITFLF